MDRFHYIIFFGYQRSDAIMVDDAFPLTGLLNMRLKAMPKKVVFLYLSRILTL